MNPRTAILLVAAAFSLDLTGCNSLRGFPALPATSSASAPTPGYQLGPGAILDYNSAKDLDSKLLIRNDIIDARMAELDRQFGEFERALYAEGIGTGLGSDWALLALTLASTLSTVTTTKTTLSAVATAVAGGDAAFDKRALFDKTLPALLAQMVAQRETIRLQIRTSERLMVRDYSWFAAESDLQAFAYAGSIPGALAGVAQDAGEKASAARKDQLKLTTLTFNADAYSDRLRGFWKPGGGKANPANAAAIHAWMKDKAKNDTLMKEWMKKNDITDTDSLGAIPAFVTSGDPALRAEAVKDLIDK